MGIGRRQFLQLSSLALAHVVVDPFQAVVTNESLYLNRQLGILFYKPKDWGFIKVKDFKNLQNKQILGNGFEEIKDEVYDELGQPILIVTKYFEDKPQYKNTFSPTITLHITPKEEFEEFENFEEVMEMSAYGTSMILKDFEVRRRYEPYTISGCKIYEYDSTYTFEHIDLEKPTKVELKVLKAEHNGFYYDFNLHQSQEQNQTAIEEFNDFKNSIKLI